MKALIILENHFIKDKDGTVWCDRVVDYSYLKRYLDVFEKIIVCGRCSEKKIAPKSLLKVSGKNVDFIALPEFKGAGGLIKKWTEIKKIIQDNISCFDCAIMRAPSHLSLVLSGVMRKNRKPFALEFVMAANRMLEGLGLLKYILNPIIDLKFKHICKKANGVSYVTEEVLQSRYPCKALVKPNSKRYFTSSYSSIDLSDAFYSRRIIKLSNKSCNLIHIGYMDSNRKGQDIAIKVAKILHENGYNVDLKFIGDGEKMSQYKKMVKDYKLENNVHFLGSISDKAQLARELRKSEILIFPTISEGLPRVVIEAMANSLICLASPVDGVPELLDEKCLVKRSPELYYKKIQWLFNDSQYVKKNCERNFNKSLCYKKELLDNRRRDFYSRLKKETENV